MAAFPMILFLGACSPAVTSPANDWAGKLAQVEQVCNRQLGIGLNELGLLLEAEPGTVYSARSATLMERRAALEALQRAGYVRTQVLGGPDASFVAVERTQSGQDVANILLSRP